MKKSLLYLMAIALFFSACKKDEETETPTAGKPGEITLTVTQNGNVVTYKATASDAVKFIWDLGNGQTPEGSEVQGTYSFPGDYDVTCTAKGRDEDRVKVQSVDVLEGDPEIFNEVNVTLSGYNAATGLSEASWAWVNAAGTMGDGPRISVPDTVYFNAIDQSWWQSGDGDLSEAALDDEYTFNLNTKMEYVNDFKEAFLINWAWAAVRGHEAPGIWEDLEDETYEAPASSWSVQYIPNINDTLTFETNINDVMMPGAYVIHLTNKASLGMESKGYDYQILKLTADTLWVRYDNTFPENLADFYDADDLANEGAIPGDPDEAYLKLYNVNSKK